MCKDIMSTLDGEKQQYKFMPANLERLTRVISRELLELKSKSSFLLQVYAQEFKNADYVEVSGNFE